MKTAAVDIIRATITTTKTKTNSTCLNQINNCNYYHFNISATTAILSTITLIKITITMEIICQIIIMTIKHINSIKIWEE